MIYILLNTIKDDREQGDRLTGDGKRTGTQKKTLLSSFIYCKKSPVMKIEKSRCGGTHL